MRRVGKGFFGVETQLFEGITIHPSPTPPTPPPQPSHDIPSTSQVQPTPPQSPQVQPQLPQPQPQSQQYARIPMNLLQEVMDTCTALSRKVEHLKLDKISQALEITKLKRRVKKLEMRNKRRMIAEMDQDADIVLEDDKEIVDEDESEPAEVQKEDEFEPPEVQEIVDVVTTTKIITKVVTAANETITAAITAAPSRRRKGVVIRDPQEEPTTSIIIPDETQSKDKGKGILVEEPKPLKKQAQIKQDEKYARELEAKLNKTIDWDEVIDHNVASFKMDYFKGMTYDDIRPIFEKHYNFNVNFLLKSKELIDEEESRVLKRINETPAEKATKR
nr:hypothetical protein [Tanacetum cinerariifolium]